MPSQLPRRIMYLDHTARWSGGEIALYRFLIALDRSQYEPIVVLGEDGLLAEKLLASDIKTIVVPLDGGVRDTRKDSLGAQGIARKLLFGGPALLSYSQKIAALATELGCAMLHCNSLKSDIYGAIAGKIAKIPVLWHVRDHISADYLPSVTVRTFRELTRRFPTHVVCNSQSTLLSLFGGNAEVASRSENVRRYSVVTDCVDRSFLCETEPTIRNSWRPLGDKRPLVIGMVGRLARWKGQHIFLQAAKILSQQMISNKDESLPSLQFVIAGGALFGEDAYEAEVKQQASEDFPAGSVRWLGNIANIPALLKELDIMVHASITPEPFGQVVIEGMAAGLPVIATAGGGVPEIIEEGRTGLLIPMGDASALAGALYMLIQNPSQGTRMGQSGWHEVQNRFLPERTASELASLYHRLLTR